MSTLDHGERPGDDRPRRGGRRHAAAAPRSAAAHPPSARRLLRRHAESAKPRLYRQARRILTADNLAGAVAAVAVLAALVNLVELLCTAGLPAVYTQVLASHDLTRPAYYGNVAIYVAAHVLDDAIVLGVAVVTRSRRRLPERGGRWLELLGGLLLASLGLVLLFRPSWLTCGAAASKGQPGHRGTTGSVRRAPCTCTPTAHHHLTWRSLR